MKKYIFILLLIQLTTAAQGQSWQWTQRLGNIKSDKVTCIKTDSLGHVYIAGYFSNQLTLGTNNLILNFTSNSSSKETFLAKFDSLGFCLWAKSGGENFDDRVLGLAVDKAGNSLITGTYWQVGGGLLMGSLVSDGSAFGWGDQCFLFKHDKDGNGLWSAFVCSESGDDQGLDVAFDKNGNGYVCGFMTGSTLFCNGSTVSAINSNTGVNPYCFWLAKINSAGVFQWARTFGNLPYDPGAFKYIERDIAVATDELGGVYVTGGFDGTQVFESTTLTSFGGHDAFTIKYDTLGDFKWVTQGGSDKDDWSNGIATDKLGNVYITGEHRDSFYMGGVAIKNYDKRDAFVYKLNASTGAAIWGKRAGSNSGGERGNDIVADGDCNVYVTGDINQSAKFGNDITTPSSDSVQAFLAKISPEGYWHWVATGGGTASEDRSNALCLGTGNQIYIAGYFRDNASMGSTSLASAGSSDGFFSRLKDASKNKGILALNLPQDTLLCTGESILLSQPTTNAITYNPVATVASNMDQTQFTITPTAASTQYTFIGQITGSCPVTDIVKFGLTIVPDPIASFTIYPETTYTIDPLFTMLNQSSGAVSYQWFYNTQLVSTSASPTFVFDTVGVYCFVLVATNSEGCTDTTTQCGRVEESKNINVSNVFVPDGQDFNNLVTLYSGADTHLHSFEIFNRWGVKVYSLENKTFLGELKTWDGRFNGQPQPLDTYVYRLVVTIQNNTKNINGNICLLR